MRWTRCPWGRGLFAVDSLPLGEGSVCGGLVALGGRGLFAVDSLPLGEGVCLRWICCPWGRGLLRWIRCQGGGACSVCGQRGALCLPLSALAGRLSPPVFIKKNKFLGLVNLRTFAHTPLFARSRMGVPYLQSMERNASRRSGDGAGIAQRLESQVAAMKDETGALWLKAGERGGGRCRA